MPVPAVVKVTANWWVRICLSLLVIIGGCHFERLHYFYYYLNLLDWVGFSCIIFRLLFKETIFGKRFEAVI